MPTQIKLRRAPKGSDLARLRQSRTEREDIWFSFDELNILGVRKDNVYLQGWVKERSVVTHWHCVILVKRPLFLKAVDLWLGDKKVYCEEHNEFCGKLGKLVAEEYVEADECDRISFRSARAKEPKRVRTFAVTRFAQSTNMEHG